MFNALVKSAVQQYIASSQYKEEIDGITTKIVDQGKLEIQETLSDVKQTVDEFKADFTAKTEQHSEQIATIQTSVDSLDVRVTNNEETTKSLQELLQVKAQM